MWTALEQGEAPDHLWYIDDIILCSREAEKSLTQCKLRSTTTKSSVYQHYFNPESKTQHHTGYYEENIDFLKQVQQRAIEMNRFSVLQGEAGRAGTVHPGEKKAHGECYQTL